MFVVFDVDVVGLDRDLQAIVMSQRRPVAPEWWPSRFKMLGKRLGLGVVYDAAGFSDRFSILDRTKASRALCDSGTLRALTSCTELIAFRMARVW